MKHPSHKPTGRQRRLGFIAGLLIGRRPSRKFTPRQLHQNDFKTSTQRLGLRFSDRLRDAFRSRWLKIK